MQKRMCANYTTYIYIYNLCSTVNKGNFAVDLVSFKDLILKMNKEPFFERFFSLETEVPVVWIISDSKQKSIHKTHLVL